MVSLISKTSEVLLVYRVMVSLISKINLWGITSVQSYGIAHLKDLSWGITSVQSYGIANLISKSVQSYGMALRYY